MKKHKSIVIFLFKFFATYFLLFAIYSFYLNNSQQKKNGFKTATITTKVASQTVWLLEAIGYHADYKQHKKELSVKLLIENQYTARVIEGCNSISLIILFISFIVAFAGSTKATILFSIIGSVLIYVINIVRIAFLTVMIYKYPTQQEFLHSIVFPVIIYGAILLLWIVWVNKFSKYKK